MRMDTCRQAAAGRGIWKTSNVQRPTSNIQHSTKKSRGSPNRVILSVATGAPATGAQSKDPVEGPAKRFSIRRRQARFKPLPDLLRDISCAARILPGAVSQSLGSSTARPKRRSAQDDNRSFTLTFSDERWKLNVGRSPPPTPSLASPAQQRRSVPGSMAGPRRVRLVRFRRRVRSLHAALHRLPAMAPCRNREP